jgi:hypothetical protein
VPGGVDMPTKLVVSLFLYEMVMVYSSLRVLNFQVTVACFRTFLQLQKPKKRGLDS